MVEKQGLLNRFLTATGRIAIKGGVAGAVAGVEWERRDTLPMSSAPVSKSIVVFDAASAEDYVAAWGGFEGPYYAFNPSFGPEDRPDAEERMTRIIRDVFIPRFATGRTTSLYLFFSDSYSSKELERFQGILRRVTRDGLVSGPALDKNIKIRRSHYPHPMLEYYAGTKKGKPVALVSLVGEPARTLGLDDYVFRLDHEAVLSSLTREFNAEWQKSGVDIVPSSFVPGLR